MYIEFATIAGVFVGITKLSIKYKNEFYIKCGKIYGENTEEITNLAFCRLMLMENEIKYNIKSKKVSQSMLSPYIFA
jgi:hypothetical protein